MGLLWLCGCNGTRIIEIPYDTISLRIISDKNAPFQVDGVPQKLNASEAISFLDYYYRVMPSKYEDPSKYETPSVVVSSTMKVSMPGEGDVYRKLDELSQKYCFRIFYMPLPHGRASTPYLQMKHLWTEYKTNTISPDDQ